jgi:hypothetical protein
MRASELRLLALTILLVLRAPSSYTQTAEVSSNLDTSSYLIRLERMQPTQDACVLVREDGQYHFERLLATKIDIFEGVLAVQQMQALQQSIDNDEVRKLTQDKIKAPTTHSPDDLFVSIARSGRWQNLKLLGSEAREPYREYVDPLLVFLEELPKEKHKSLSEDAGRNNCMPGGKIELGSRPKIALDSAKRYMMRVQITNKSEYDLRNTCVLVYGEGHYHMEQWSQRLSSVYSEATVFEGQLPDNAVQQLRALLDDPALQNRPENAPPTDFPVWQAEITALSIRRGDRIQKLAFWQYVGAKAPGSVYTPPHRENGTRVIKPLQRWLTTNLKPDSNAELPSNEANSCQTLE